MRHFLTAAFTFFVTSVLGTPPCMQLECPPEQVSDRVPWKNRVRRKALTNVDEFLHWSLRANLRLFALDPAIPSHHYPNPHTKLHDFGQTCGYFSLFHPLVGKVSPSLEDIDRVRSALKVIHEEVQNPDLASFATAEITAKTLAYRDLQIGDTFPLGKTAKGKIVWYVVDHLFSLWGKMPAFGLLPKGEGSPILLFRGTDLSLDSQRGWASLMSDVDLSGPGFSVFKKSRAELHSWLATVTPTHGKARVIGFSLGGALAAYTFIFENTFMSSEPSYAFHPPGVSDKVIAAWNDLSSNMQTAFRTYVSRGDVVSKVGKLFGTVYELSTPALMKPVSAHTALLSGHPRFAIGTVDVPKENLSR